MKYELQFRVGNVFVFSTSIEQEIEKLHSHTGQNFFYYVYNNVTMMKCIL
jgi:hypothetical protein